MLNIRPAASPNTYSFLSKAIPCLDRMNLRCWQIVQRRDDAHYVSAQMRNQSDESMKQPVNTVRRSSEILNGFETKTGLLVIVHLRYLISATRTHTDTHL